MQHNPRGGRSASIWDSGLEGRTLCIPQTLREAVEGVERRKLLDRTGTAREGRQRTTPAIGNSQIKVRWDRVSKSDGEPQTERATGVGLLRGGGVRKSPRLNRKAFSIGYRHAWTFRDHKYEKETCSKKVSGYRPSFVCDLTAALPKKEETTQEEKNFNERETERDTPRDKLTRNSTGLAAKKTRFLVLYKVVEGGTARRGEKKDDRPGLGKRHMRIEWEH